MEIAIVEILPSIKSCRFFGKISKDFGKLKKINIKESSCSFILEDSSEIVIEFPSGASLLSESASGYNFDGSSIVFRMQLCEKTTIVHNVMAELMDELDDFNPFKSSYLHFKPDESLRVTCLYCSTSLTRVCNFRRTCQLPSVNWEQSSEDWFCCLKKTVKDSIKPHSLQPSEDECFYAELFYVLSKDVLNSDVTITDNQIICHECNFQIGNIINNSARFWKHSMKWVNESNEVLYYQTESESIVSLFDNIDKDNFGVNCRLVLEKQTSPKEYIFMVTMDTNLKFLMSPNVFFGNKYHSNYDDKGKNNDAGGLSVENSIPIKKLCLKSSENSEDNSNDITTIKLNKYKVIKLLFKHKVDDDDESASWIDDINVHILPCGDKFFDTVMKQLNNSNSLLPNQSNSVNDMNIGYIMRE